MKQPVIQMDRMELENKIKDLEKALSDERFKTRAYEIYLEELEKVVGKPSSKKSGTVQ